MIERAIRASLMELQAASHHGDDEAAIQRAIKASVKEAQRARAASSKEFDGADEHDQHLKSAIEQSLQEHGHLTRAQSAPSNNEVFEDSGVDTDDDEHVKAAIERSKTDLGAGGKDEELEKAIELSKRAGEDHAQELSKTKTEERIVLDYVKKQSALEEEHKQKMASATKAADPNNEELQRAMQASLKVEGEKEEPSQGSLAGA